MFPQRSFLLEPALFEDASRRWIERGYLRGDFHQPEFVEGMLADPVDDGGHDASAPERLAEPVANFRAMRLTNLEVVEAAGTDQGIVSCADGSVFSRAR